MIYVIDTNIILSYVRSHSLWNKLSEKYDFYNSKNRVIISVVSVGEIYAIAKRQRWGKRKLEQLEEFLSFFVITSINVEEVIESYANIDAFSQGKLANHPLNLSARNMGKNDLWIAATASVLNAHLITLDKDFSHLHEKFIQLIQISLDK